MAESYSNNIKSLIGRVTASVVSDNYFPLVGNTLKMDAATRWGKTSEWQTKDGGGEIVTVAGNPLHDKDSKSILIAGTGELQQRFIARNDLFSAEVVKTVYAMQPQALPYFDLNVSKEIIRADGIATQIRIAPENGYTGEHTVVVRIYKENETADPVFTATNSVQADGYKYVEFSTSTAADRGIYDVEVDVIDAATGKVLSKRIDKLITVTPKLCPKPADTSTGYEVAATYNSFTTYATGKIPFELRLWRNVSGSGLNYAEAIIPSGEQWNSSYDRIPLAVLPAGTTLCLKLDTQEAQPYKTRLLVTGNQDPTKDNTNGTPNFTKEAPLVITHDCTDIWQWGWCSYGAVNLDGNCRNIVFDGMGYHDTEIHFFPFDSATFTDSCFFVVNGTSDYEMFSCDIDGAGFAGVTAKTDPKSDRPWFWRENGWEFKDLKIHHCKMRNTVGEGVYLGYFYSGSIGSYHAHIMRDIRLYHCVFSRNGYDSVQINNACGVEFCYNLLEGCGYRREPDQGSAFSCTMDGRVYNCVVKDNYNILGVIGPFLGKLEIFNCILTAARFNPAWTLAERVISTGTDDCEYDIHNNVVKASVIARLVGMADYNGYTMNDNIFITEDGNTSLPGYFKGTGNIFMKADLDYENIDTMLKVADSANYNYQIAYNSQAVTAGRNRKALFDMRGYKNWFSKVSHAGPFMGIYKDPAIVDVGIIFSSLTLADGQPFTLSRDIKVSLVYNGEPTKYRLGETTDLSAVEWIDLPVEGDIIYTLSEGFGAKTVYAQVASATEESVVLATNIVYQSVPLSLDSMTLTGGYNKMAIVTFNYSGSFVPTKYRLDEKADLSGVEWIDLPVEGDITYAFETAGVKTLYGQLRDTDGNVSEIKNNSITVSEGNPKIVLSVGWNNSDFKDKSHYDTMYRLTKVNFEGIAKDIPIYYQDGTQAGNYSKMDVVGQDWTQSNSKGYITGSDSGAYPDVILEHNIIVGTNVVNRSRNLHFSVPAGRYKIRLLCNTTFNRYKPAKIKYTVMVGEAETLFSLPPTYTFVNNVQEFLEMTIDVPEDGFNIKWGTVETDGEWIPVPLNVVEIEKV